MRLHNLVNVKGAVHRKKRVGCGEGSGHGKTSGSGGKGQKDMVVLPYKDRLLLFSRYLQQLVMESIGKQLDLKGNRVEQGRTVYGNKGSTDQHAYVQQLREGVPNFFAVFVRVLEDGGPFPDLILIDGGKGQLTAAYEALAEIGLANLVAVGIAKKEELLFTRDRDEPIVIAESDPGLLLIQRIRDEAHRFAVTFHRRARSMRDLRSVLEDVPGLGPRRRRALLTAFGSLAGVRRATREELAAIVGPKGAGAVIDYFARSG